MYLARSFKLQTIASIHSVATSIQGKETQKLYQVHQLATQTVLKVYSFNSRIGRHGFYFQAERGLLPPRAFANHLNRSIGDVGAFIRLVSQPCRLLRGN